MPTTSEELADLKAQIELEEAKQHLAALRGEKQRSIEETAQDINLFKNGYLYDDPRMRPSTGGTFHVTQLRDRQRGRNYPVYECEDDLQAIRGDARLLANENEAGIGAKQTLYNFTIGTGLKYDVSLKKKVSPRGNVRLVNRVQDWIDEFIERTNWVLPEKEMHGRCIEDGEPFLELVPIGGGRCEPLFHEADAITEPHDKNMANDYIGAYSLDWLFGVGTPIGRPSKPEAYFVDLSGDQNDWDIVPEERMIHAKRNVVDNCKRGVSDYYPVASSLRRADKVLRNTGDGAALQSAIAWIREHPPGTTGSQVLSLGTGKTEYEYNRPTLEGNTRTHRQQVYLPGTILDVRNGQQYKPGPMGSGSTTFIDVSGAILRYVGLRWNIPEFMISGDTGNTNFASILVAESPFVKAMESEQIYFANVFREVMWKMLGVAARAGVFAGAGIYTRRQLQERLKLEVQVPRVSVRNRLEETKIRSILFEYGLLSGPTWATREELSYEHEQEQRQAQMPLLYIDPMEAAQFELQAEAMAANTESAGQSQLGKTQPGQKQPVQVQKTARGDRKAAARLRKIGLGVGIGQNEFQPQANEPGNVGSKEGT